MSGGQVVIVVGPGRSGTSLLMQILTARGMKGAPPTQVNISNPEGGFEDLEIRAAHSAIFASLPFPPLLLRSLTRVDQAGLASSHGAALAEIVRRNVEEGSVWGFKDPRASTLTPLWNQVLQQMDISPRYVLCVRHPAAVAESYRRHFPRERELSEYLWLIRTIDPLLTNPERIFVVHYEDWFSDPAQRARLVIELMRFVGLPSDGIDETLDAVVKPTLNRSFTAESVNNPHLRELYAALRGSETLGRPPAAAVKLAMEITPIIDNYMTAAREIYAGAIAARAKEVARLATELKQLQWRSNRQMTALRDEHAGEVARLGEEIARHKEIATSRPAPQSGEHIERLVLLATRLARQRAKSDQEIAGLREDLRQLAEQHRLQAIEVKRAVEALGRGNGTVDAPSPNPAENPNEAIAGPVAAVPEREETGVP